MKYAFIVLSLLVISCSWNHVCTKTGSYNIGEEKISVVGTEVVRDGCFASRWEPTGPINKLLNRSSYNDDYFIPWIDKELIYTGRAGDTLHMTYREYSVNGIARTPFFQQVYYDLKKSNEIIFQDWIIKVIDADNHLIRFKVVK